MLRHALPGLVGVEYGIATESEFVAAGDFDRLALGRWVEFDSHP
jgi:hypothetical protein